MCCGRSSGRSWTVPASPFSHGGLPGYCLLRPLSDSSLGERVDAGSRFRPLEGMSCRTRGRGPPELLGRMVEPERFTIWRLSFDSRKCQTLRVPQQSWGVYLRLIIGQWFVIFLNLNRGKALNEAQRLNDLNGAKRLRINPLMVSPSNHWAVWNWLRSFR